MNKFLKSIGVTVSVIPLMFSASYGMQFSYNPTTHFLNLSGEVMITDTDTLQTFIDNNVISRITLGPSLGGEGTAGAIMSNEILEKKIPTEDVDDCFSACALIFAGGRSSTMYVDNDTANFVGEHCAKYNEEHSSDETGLTDFSLNDDDIELTKTLLNADGFDDKFVSDYINKCDRVNNNNVFNFENFLVDHGFKIVYLN